MRTVRAVAIAIAVIGGMCSVATAHPLGNFTSNHLTRLSVAKDAITLHYVLDDAEIPTFSLLRSLDRNGRPSQAQLNAWAAQHAAAIIPQLTLNVNGTDAALRVTNVHVRLRPGAAGLSILYFTADYRAARPAGVLQLEYDDHTLAGRIGWKDVVVFPHREPTGELQNYPGALLGSPRDRTGVTVAVDSSGAVSVADARDRPLSGLTSTARMNDLSDVLARNVSDPLALLGALLLAIGLGALHALEPGHGKTLLAISLVGSRATVSQAAILAIALTIAHTMGVLIFGVVVLTLARFVVPEALYPWIALGSGIFIAVLGARALGREIVRRTSRADGHAHNHVHSHGHDNHHHEHHDDDGFSEAVHAHSHLIPGTAPISFRSALIAAGTGNVAPCPAALVVLLAAIATHRVGYGLILIVAFSIGLALTLTLLGVAVVRGAAWLTQRPQFDRAARFAPLVTAAVIALIGSWMIGQGVVAQGYGDTPVWAAVLVIAAIALYIVLRLYRRPLARAVG